MARQQRRGAKRPTGRRISFAGFLQGLSFVLLLGLAGAASYGLRELYLIVDQPLTDVRVGGDFTHLEPSDLSAVVENNLRGGFLSVDLALLQEKLLEHPWIAEVSLRRRWPSMLEVEVLEEVPIARWGEHGFLNQYGEELMLEDNSGLAALPVLRSEFKGASDAREMMRNYQQLAQLLARVDLKLSQLRRDKLGTWWVETDPQLKLVLGRDQVAEKIRRFNHVWLSGLREHQMRIKRVDLRYPNGLAVAWKEAAKEVALQVYEAEARKTVKLTTVQG